MRGLLPALVVAIAVGISGGHVSLAQTDGTKPSDRDTWVGKDRPKRPRKPRRPKGADTTTPYRPFRPGPLTSDMGEEIRQIVIALAQAHLGADGGNRVLQLKPGVLLEATLNGQKYSAEPYKSFTVVAIAGKTPQVGQFNVKTLSAWTLRNGKTIPKFTCLGLERGMYKVDDPTKLSTIDRLTKVNEDLYKQFTKRAEEPPKKNEEKEEKAAEKKVEQLDDIEDQIKKHEKALEQYERQLREYKDREKALQLRYDRNKTWKATARVERIRQIKAQLKVIENDIEKNRRRQRDEENRINDVKKKLSAAKRERDQLKKGDTDDAQKELKAKQGEKKQRIHAAYIKHKRMLQGGQLLTESEMKKNYNAALWGKEPPPAAGEEKKPTALDEWK